MSGYEGDKISAVPQLSRGGYAGKSLEDEDMALDDMKKGGEGEVHVGAAGDMDVLPEEEGVAAKQDLEVDQDELEMLEGRLSEMSLDRTTVIARELFKMHKNDQNFPQEALNRLEDFINARDSMTDNTDERVSLVREVKLECLLATENSPYLEVRANAEATDDPTMSSLTFRVWVIGTIFAGAGCFIDVLFSFRQPAVYVGTSVGQLLAYPFGNFMAKVLPRRQFTLFGKTMSLNPGPFNRKEHMLITLMCNVSLSSPYTTNIVPVQALPIFFNQSFAYNTGYQFLNTLGTNFVGYGLAGLTRRFLVWPSFAVWPGTFNNMALIKAFHSGQNEPVKGPFGRIYTASREKVFLISFLAMAVYFFFPGYLFQALSYFNWTTWIAPDNVALVAVTGSVSGMGLNPITTFDWNIASVAFPPLVLPTFSVVNIFISQLVATFVIFGVWWGNLWNTAYLPINSNDTWDNTGNLYNVSRILTPEGNFDNDAYQAYSQPWMSAAFVVDYIFYFVMYTATITYCAIFHRHEIALAFSGLYRSIRRSVRKSEIEEEDELSEDIHYRLMKQNYKDVPEWVYFLVLCISTAIGMIGVGVYKSNTSPVVVIYGIIMPLFCMIPCGLIQAVTGLTVPTNVLAEFVGGALVAGNADALMYFKTYGYISCYQALLFSNDLKLAHYSKLPPWHTFTVQMWATLIYSFVAASVFNFAMGLKGICTADATFSFTCPGQTVYFTAAVFWGTLSPKRLFGAGKRYNTMLIGFPLGVVLVLVYWAMRRRWPRWQLLRQIHPVLLCEGPVWIASPYNISYFTPTLYITLFSFQYMRKRYTQMWAKYNYVIAAAFPTGIAVTAVIVFFALEIPKGGISVNWWGNTVSYQGCEGSGGCPLLLPPNDTGYFGPPMGSFT